MFIQNLTAVQLLRPDTALEEHHGLQAHQGEHKALQMRQHNPLSFIHAKPPMNMTLAPAVCRHVPGCLCCSSTGPVCQPPDAGTGWQCPPTAGPAGLVQRAPARGSSACMPDARPKPAADRQRQGGQAGAAPTAVRAPAACCRAPTEDCAGHRGARGRCCKPGRDRTRPS